MSETPLTPSFAEEIEAHRTAETAPADAVGIETAHSSLAVRLRGSFITGLELTSPTLGERVGVLYSGPDLSVPKLSASHVMSPAGPSEGIGGQHGFPRWADYFEFPVGGDTETERHLALQARRSDNGPGLSREFDLRESSLTTRTTLRNPSAEAVKTSLGEHYYFMLADEEFEGLTVNGKPLDELRAGVSLDDVKTSETLPWQDFDGEAVIKFPAGHSIKLSAEFRGNAKFPLIMWIWHRQGTPSICFEPVVGVNDEEQNDGVELAPHSEATLSTTIELL